MTDSGLKIDTKKYISLKDAVYNAVRDSILSGKYEPGQRIMENDIAAQLGVSRTPVREALRMLEKENLLQITPRRGAEVLAMSAKDVKNVLEIRSALEMFATEKASQKMDDSQINELIKRQNMFVEACRQNDCERAADCDEAFHDIIYNTTDNEKLIDVFNSLKAQLHAYRSAYLKVSGLMGISINHHYDIIEAIKNHNSDLAAQKAREHIRHQSEIMVELINGKRGNC